jgi:2-phospho-L-lactate guanylyltransferase
VRQDRPVVAGWSVVLPVKGGPAAKSRLAARPGLALAMAGDCVAAVTATPGVDDVVVVTADPAAAALATGLGARAVDQPATAPGLSGAVRTGLAACDQDAPVAVLLADLPSLRPQDLAAALDAVSVLLREGRDAVVVPDADGTGSVLLAAGRPSGVRHAFGAGSAGRHEELGAHRLEDVPARLRRDVDTRTDLVAALELGVGPRTARTLRDVQATVLRYDPETRGGEVVTDDGLRLAMAPGALEGSGLRHLRPGQRVTCSPGDDGTVTGVHLRGISGD